MADSSVTPAGGMEFTPLFKSLLQETARLHKRGPEPQQRRLGGFVMAIDPIAKKEGEELDKPQGLFKSLEAMWARQDAPQRLAFESDPGQSNTYAALYRNKMRLVPDTILKRIGNTDDLVAAIVMARMSQVSVMGRPREERFDNGYLIEPKKGVLDKCSPQEQEELQGRIERATERLKTCGSTEGWDDQEKLSFSDWLKQTTRYAMLVGRGATEAVWIQDESGKPHFHSFRIIDAGTVYRAAPQKQAAQSVREAARVLLERVKNEKIRPEKYLEDEYTWVQVVDGRPVQAFTSKECLVKNFYPVADIELDGYPVTPIDTMLSAVTTHINITTHNKLYFQHGRAARGMLIIESADVNDAVIQTIRQQFNASINSVNNAWRMPVFGVTPGDKLTWQPIDSGQRDMEFQYLMDMNARVILSAFQMSPEELPGWTYLSRGTNNQALSESNNEYQLEAHRDLGIRPLIKQLEDYVNDSIFPLLDPSLAKLCRVRFAGLDAQTEEKEAVRLGQDAPLHLTQNDIMDKVEKDPIDPDLCGDVLLSPAWQALVDKYQYVGVIREKLMGMKEDSQKPEWMYVRDPFWFQWQQMVMQMKQMAMQAQNPQAPPPNGGPAPDGSGGPGGAEEPSAPPPTGNQGGGPPEGSAPDGGAPAPPTAGDLTRSLDQVIGLLTKSEAQLPPSKRRLLARQRKLVEQVVKGIEADAERATRDIMKLVERHPGV